MVAVTIITCYTTGDTRVNVAHILVISICIAGILTLIHFCYLEGKYELCAYTRELLKVIN